MLRPKAVVATMQAAAPSAAKIESRYTAQNARVMPTMLVSQRPLGELWLSSIDPVLNADWLAEKGVR